MKKLIYILTLFVLGACGNPSQPNSKPILTVTLEPLRYFTEVIAGDNYEVVSMVPKGSSPESYDPTPQQLVNLSQSQAYLRIGYIGFEQTWMKKLEANCPNMKVFDTSKGVDLIRSGGHWHNDHFHEGGVEPHIWTSTNNAIVIADNICAALCELDSIHQDGYKHRTDSLKEVIAQTESHIRQHLQNADSTFLIYHPALSYFARDYGLKQISIEEGGKEPSPAQLKALIETCRKEKARTIFVQQEFDQRNAQLIADELGVTIVSINPLSYDWSKEMIRVAEALKH
ncbi:MAG: zinc ABC transporter substrate-binding protein [Bacteroidaceae bacterium]|nr:zinc ABC transporter substrate-binding protein [Bacteroidaceae bacterium]